MRCLLLFEESQQRYLPQVSIFFALDLALSLLARNEQLLIYF